MKLSAERKTSMARIAAVLLILWMLALLRSLTFGGWIHLLPVLAAGFLIGWMLRRRTGKPLTPPERKH
ncbi:MAG TPA: hypothetical protein VM557_10310 [Thermoanaerobaculia bacterium]|nr:hypothetical protein [Thermoanaerobaculia bacterium]